MKCLIYKSKINSRFLSNQSKFISFCFLSVNELIRLRIPVAMVLVYASYEFLLKSIRIWRIVQSKKTETARPRGGIGGGHPFLLRKILIGAFSKFENFDSANFLRICGIIRRFSPILENYCRQFSLNLEKIHVYRHLSDNFLRFWRTTVHSFLRFWRTTSHNFLRLLRNTVENLP